MKHFVGLPVVGEGDETLEVSGFIVSRVETMEVKFVCVRVFLSVTDSNTIIHNKGKIMYLEESLHHIEPFIVGSDYTKKEAQEIVRSNYERMTRNMRRENIILNDLAEKIKVDKATRGLK